MLAKSFVFLALLRLTASESVSITELPAYSAQKPCARKCFTNGAYEGPDKLANYIGCEYHLPQNECVCRSDIQQSADSWLSSCVSNSCSRNEVDASSAVSIYDAYCTNAGYLRIAQVTPTSTSSDIESPTSSFGSQTPTFTGTIINNGDDNRGELGTGEIVGIVVGVLGFIATAIGTWFTYKAIRNKRQAHYEAKGGPHGGPYLS
ncbi:hypothetical protein F5B22DRAFT_489897 [Xylaria bambusicola]|uniref:uncharacterized protein n=1 Tax=Xylaria bambusicola TaxID=326684 RepID=UPI0020078C4B|nr:uncharacterized protein F5B22DRAFT_489897 [Xylaria bambusicola]KAI0505856.1 hypothetical protein F5B22DRAFT_489897 [Xylaria bambusicola]